MFSSGLPTGAVVGAGGWIGVAEKPVSFFFFCFLFIDVLVLYCSIFYLNRIGVIHTRYLKPKPIKLELIV